MAPACQLPLIPDEAKHVTLVDEFDNDVVWDNAYRAMNRLQALAGDMTPDSANSRLTWRHYFDGAELPLEGSPAIYGRWEVASNPTGIATLAGVVPSGIRPYVQLGGRDFTQEFELMSPAPIGNADSVGLLWQIWSQRVVGVGGLVDIAADGRFALLVGISATVAEANYQIGIRSNDAYGSGVAPGAPDYTVSSDIAKGDPIKIRVARTRDTTDSRYTVYKVYWWDGAAWQLVEETPGDGWSARFIADDKADAIFWTQKSTPVANPGASYDLASYLYWQTLEFDLVPTPAAIACIDTWQGVQLLAKFTLPDLTDRAVIVARQNDYPADETDGQVLLDTDSAGLISQQFFREASWPPVGLTITDALLESDSYWYVRVFCFRGAPENCGAYSLELFETVDDAIFLHGAGYFERKLKELLPALYMKHDQDTQGYFLPLIAQIGKLPIAPSPFNPFWFDNQLELFHAIDDETGLIRSELEIAASTPMPERIERHQLERFLRLLAGIPNSAYYRARALAKMINGQEIDGRLLQHLAWLFGLIFPEALSFSERRQLLSRVVAQYRVKGTIEGLINMAASITGIVPTVISWANRILYSNEELRWSMEVEDAVVLLMYTALDESFYTPDFDGIVTLNGFTLAFADPTFTISDTDIELLVQFMRDYAPATLKWEIRVNDVVVATYLDVNVGLILYDRFDSMVDGSVDGQNGWRTDITWLVPAVVDGAAWRSAGKSLLMTGPLAGAFKLFTRGVIAKLRLRAYFYVDSASDPTEDPDNGSRMLLLANARTDPETAATVEYLTANNVWIQFGSDPTRRYSWTGPQIDAWNEIAITVDVILGKVLEARVNNVVVFSGYTMYDPAESVNVDAIAFYNGSATGAADDWRVDDVKLEAL